MDVTAPELRSHLDEYLAAVDRGEVVRVTRDGAVVAEIRSVRAAATTGWTRLDQLVAQGRATAGNGRPLGPYRPQPAERSATELILEDRDDERW